ncbi:Pentatricopeptide repeat [Dillenia turbinata]|uniref:Pentatricopeptide repeat n=1 Tax=Dillenia turbinata TaxID=194707 RepID=A0AAN8Z041_9MAGN
MSEEAISLDRLWKFKSIETKKCMLSLFWLEYHGNVVVESSLVDILMEDVDLYSFGTMLHACSGLAAVREGKEVHCRYLRRGVWRDAIVESSAMVDLYAKCGCVDFAERVFSLVEEGLIEEAENLILNADCKDSALWEVFVGACTASTNPVVAERIARKLMELERDKYLSYVFLSNLYRSIGRWNDALELRKLMSDRKVKKMPGKSWIDTDNSLGSYHMGQWNTTKLSSASNLG